MEQIAARLRAQAAAPDLAALPGRAAALLHDATFLRQQLSNPEARLTEARAALASLAAEARTAWQRYPAVGHGGFHGGGPDPRPLALAWAVRFVREVGLYRPDELTAMLADATVTPAWAAAEALRFCVFLAALRLPLDEVLEGRLRQSGLEAQALELARVLAAARLPPMAADRDATATTC